MQVGNYRVIKQISEGTFGRTFLGEHVHLKKPVCLKQEKTGEDIYRKLFADEARLLWDLHHTSLPTLKEFYDLPDVGMVAVLSFIEGEDLQTVREKRGAVADEHLCWIMQRLLEALAYLHYHKVIHCDIKPQNILLNIPVHNAVLVDFGLYVQDPTRFSRAKGGTPFFMPPEFLQGLPPIPASDLYSLGMTMVFLAGGNVKNGALPNDMKPELTELISTMIRRDPLARPQCARQLNEQLTHLRRRLFNRVASSTLFETR